MKNKIFTLLIVLISPSFLFGQEYTQYFDGADTLVQNAIFIDFGSDSTNIWQIGPPQKTIFESASTVPNALLTDTINSYPNSDSSSFYFTVDPSLFTFGILALSWNQKLDYENGSDGGLIEYTVDGGTTWSNIFNNPYVYNLYGYDSVNQDTLSDGTAVFTGTDEEWKNVWLCFDVSWLSNADSLVVKFTSISDSIDTNQEGWMIDNLYESITFIHTLTEAPQKKYLEVYPNPSSGQVFIQTQKRSDYHIIEQMELSDSSGKILKHYNTVPTKFNIDISDLPKGIYYLKVQTNIKTETVPIIKQ